MSKSNIKCSKKINTIFNNAFKVECINKEGDYLKYTNYVEYAARRLLMNIKTKRSNLVKVSACLIGYAYDQHSGDIKALNLACDIVNEMAIQLGNKL